MSAKASAKVAYIFVDRQDGAGIGVSICPGGEFGFGYGGFIAGQ
jgi:hypothetical protein